MRRRCSARLLIVAFIGFCTPARAEDWSGRWAAGGLLYEAVPAGKNTANDLGGSSPGVGFMIRYGLDSHWGLGGSFEYVDVSRGGHYHSGLFAVSEVYSWMPESRWRPFVEGGVGAAQTLSLRSAAGVEYFWRPDFSARFQGTFYYLPDVGGTPSRQTAYVAAPGVMVSYFFDFRKPTPRLPELPPPPPALQSQPTVPSTPGR